MRKILLPSGLTFNVRQFIPKLETNNADGLKPVQSIISDYERKKGRNTAETAPVLMPDLYQRSELAGNTFYSRLLAKNHSLDTYVLRNLEDGFLQGELMEFAKENEIVSLGNYCDAVNIMVSALVAGRIEEPGKHIAFFSHDDLVQKLVATRTGAMQFKLHTCSYTSGATLASDHRYFFKPMAAAQEQKSAVNLMPLPAVMDGADIWVE